MILQLKNTKGFSFIEAVLAMVILSLSLITGLIAISNVMADTVDVEYSTLATHAANEKLEMIIADNEYQGYDYITATNYPDDTTGVDNNLSRSVSIVEVNANDLTTPEASSGLKKIDVTVNWGPLTNQEVVLTTLLVDYE